MHSQADEVERNYDVFERLLPDLLATHRGHHVLIRHARVVDFFDDVSTALAAGRGRFSDGVFSVQEVTDRPVDLGFYSHAIHPRIA